MLDSASAADSRCSGYGPVRHDSLQCSSKMLSKQISLADQSRQAALSRDA